MNVDCIKAFRQATLSVLESYGFGDPRVDKILVAEETYARGGAVAVAIGLSGDLAGVLAFAFPREELAAVASHVVRAPIGPEQVEDQHDIASEFANIVAGHAMGQLYGQGLGVDISPPTLQPGPDVVLDLSGAADSVVIPVVTAQGGLEVVVSLRFA